MTSIRSAAIVGLGLIGGSVARDLKARGIRVIGADRDPLVVAAAVDSGIVSAAAGPSHVGIEGTDVVILAVPVAQGPSLLREIAPFCGSARLVTDTGSTKGTILAAAEATEIAARFVGAHPYAGDHRSGWQAARRDLFTGARVFLVPGRSATDEAVRRAHEFWSLLGGIPEITTATEHDRLLALSSHLPHVLASAMARVLAASGIPRPELGSGGRDMTRLAGSSPEIWSAISTDNAPFIGQALDVLREELDRFATALRRTDAAELSRLFGAGRTWFEEDLPTVTGQHRPDVSRARQTSQGADGSEISASTSPR